MNEVLSGLIGVAILATIIFFILDRKTKRKLDQLNRPRPSPPKDPEEIELPPPASDPLKPRPRPRHPREK